MVWTVEAIDNRYAEQLLEILNESIANDTALYEYQPRTLENVLAWFEHRQQNGLPIIGIVKDKRLLGFGSYGEFRPKPAYKYTVEHSLYVHPEAKGQGIGKAILAELIAIARKNQLHTMIGGIDAANLASIALHQKMGFECCGIIKQSGFKFGQWLDLAFYQLLLDTPDNPVDG